MQDSKRWLHHAQWKDGNIQSEGRSGFWAILAFTLFWNLFSWGAVWVITSDPEQAPTEAYWALALFPAVGILFIFLTIRSGIRWCKFGTAVFRMKHIPGVIGGTLEGDIIVPTRVVPEKGFVLTLTNNRLRITGSGDDRKSTTTQLWQHQQSAAGNRLASSKPTTVVSLNIAIPPDCLETNYENKCDQIFWQLELSAEVPGVNYRASFGVPVFRTELL